MATIGLGLATLRPRDPGGRASANPGGFWHPVEGGAAAVRGVMRGSGLCYDHALSGEWSDHRDCHVKPDLILIYQKPDADTLRLVRLGSHSELGFLRSTVPVIHLSRVAATTSEEGGRTPASAAGSPTVPGRQGVQRGPWRGSQSGAFDASLVANPSAWAASTMRAHASASAPASW